MEPEEQYKQLEDVTKQDPRSEVMGRIMKSYSTLELWHEYIDQIQLASSVPDDVQRNFNHAKHLSLYAWYVYDFHQAAELNAAATLEMAMKVKCEQQGVVAPRGMRKLYDRAQQEGWIIEEWQDDGKILSRYRNDLAHGTTLLHEQSPRTLAVCAGYINQLFHTSTEQSDEAE